MNYIWQNLQLVKILTSILLLLFLFFFDAAYSAVTPHPLPTSKSQLQKFYINTIEQQTGRKLGFLEKLQAKLLIKRMHKLKAAITDKQEKQAQLSMIMGIVSLLLLSLVFTSVGIVALLSIPAAIIALVLGLKSRKGNSNQKGLIGIITGGITLGVIILYTILILIFFTSFTFE